MNGQKGTDQGSDYGTHPSEDRAPLRGRAETWVPRGAARESRCKSNHRAERGVLGPRPAVLIPLNLEHVVSFCRYRPDRYVLWRPPPERTAHRPRFQGQADAIAAVQPREGLPVVPVLPMSRCHERGKEH